MTARARSFRLGAYATGNYMCTCVHCGERFTGDKRAVNCLPCAAEDAVAALAALQSERDVLRTALESIRAAESWNSSAVQCLHYAARTARQALAARGGG